MLRIDGKYVVNNKCLFGDKSITHRALIFGSIATDKVVINNAVVNQDTIATMRCLKALGAKFDVKDNSIVVSPIENLPCGIVTLDCANSGTTARLLAGLVCGLNVEAVFVGDRSLSRRPMNRVINPLRSMGANITTGEGILFEIRKSGGLCGIDYVSEIPSAQVKSAIILAGLFAQGKTTILENIPTRDHTELMAEWLGCDVKTTNNTTIVKQSRPHGGVVDVPQDLSTVAFLTALSLKYGVVNINNVGLNPTRTCFLEILQKSGLSVEVSDCKTLCGETRGNLTVKYNNGQLLPIQTSVRESAMCIDELPILATIACFIKGESVFCGINELRKKESDRVVAIISLCNSLGRQAYCDNDNLHVIGDDKLIDCCVEVNTYHDHRIAMCGVIVATFCKSVIIDDEQCIDVSTPNFLQILSVKRYECALLGEDISQSKSPLLMCMLAESAKVNLSYELLEVSQSINDSQLINLLSKYDGVNVTMPYKQRIAKLYNSSCASVNTIGKGVEACSTDGYGLIKALESNGIDVKGKKILVVGAGGTAYIAVESLLSHGALVNIINRTQSKADELAKQYGIDYCLDNFDGIVSCIPVCEYENNVALNKNMSFVFSVNYKQRSKLLDKAELLGIKTIDGLPMLFWQGVASFELWTGVKVKEDLFNTFLQRVKK